MKHRLFSILLGLSLILACSGTAWAASGFEDVSGSAYYAEAVDWAVSQQITNGTTATAFSPDRTCTDAEILTFLWRANGSPEPSVENPFSNLTSDRYYYKAALWAYEKGMLSGTAFQASTPCTRGTTTLYLWRAAGSPEAGDTSFADVLRDADYRQAVAWAAEQRITTGTGDGTFSPDRTCTRAQIVTFLYRARDIWQTSLTGEQEVTAMPKLDITVNDQHFTATLQDNPTTRALLERLPMSVTMGELNGNEKYYYLPSGLPADSQRPGQIHAGDLMLFGSDCLVLFYESFSSGYSYTRLGKIDDPTGLASAVGRGNVTVMFCVQ